SRHERRWRHDPPEPCRGPLPRPRHRRLRRSLRPGQPRVDGSQQRARRPRRRPPPAPRFWLHLPRLRPPRSDPPPRRRPAERRPRGGDGRLGDRARSRVGAPPLDVLAARRRRAGAPPALAGADGQLPTVLWTIWRADQLEPWMRPIALREFI